MLKTSINKVINTTNKKNNNTSNSIGSSNNINIKIKNILKTKFNKNLAKYNKPNFAKVKTNKK